MRVICFIASQLGVILYSVSEGETIDNLFTLLTTSSNDELLRCNLQRIDYNPLSVSHNDFLHSNPSLYKERFPLAFSVPSALFGSVLEFIQFSLIRFLILTLPPLPLD